MVLEKYNQSVHNPDYSNIVNQRWIIVFLCLYFYYEHDTIMSLFTIKSVNSDKKRSLFSVKTALSSG